MKYWQFGGPHGLEKTKPVHQEFEFVQAGSQRFRIFGPSEE